jgi:hypothetical protein
MRIITSIICESEREALIVLANEFSKPLRKYVRIISIGKPRKWVSQVVYEIKIKLEGKYFTEDDPKRLDSLLKSVLTPEVNLYSSEVAVKERADQIGTFVG